MNTPRQEEGNLLPEPPETLAFGKVRLRLARVVSGDATHGLVPYYHFRILLADGTDVGHLNFRVGDTEHVRLCAGHVGYKINEPYRGRGLAFEACRAVAPFVRTFYSTVTMTCNPDNEASMRIILRLGARFIDEIVIPPNDPNVQAGVGRKRRYRWTL